MSIVFQEKLKNLTKQYIQSYIADKTGFYQSDINNFLAGTSKPSLQLLRFQKPISSLDGFLFKV